jgi:hypothetical protein
MRRHDRPGRRRNGTLERRRIERERVAIDIHKHRPQACASSQFRNDPEGQRRKDDLRSCWQIERTQDVKEGHAAVGGGDRRAEPSRASNARSNCSICGPRINSPRVAQPRMMSSVAWTMRTP